jgi:hypothetical protein
VDKRGPRRGLSGISSRYALLCRRRPLSRAFTRIETKAALDTSTLRVVEATTRGPLTW